MCGFLFIRQMGLPRVPLALLALLALPALLSGGPPQAAAAEGPALEVDCPQLKKIYLPADPRYAAYVMKVQSNQELLCLARGEAVYRALLRRAGIHPKYRAEAVAGLARLHDTDLLTEWLAAVKQIGAKGITLERKQERVQPTVAQIRAVLAAFAAQLRELPQQQLAARRAELARLARQNSRPEVRALGYAALIAADGDAERAWETARGERLGDLIAAMPWISNQQIRSALYARLQPLLKQALAEDLRQSLFSALPSVPGHDEEIFALLVPGVLDKESRDAAVTALLGRAADKWPRGDLVPLAEKLLALLAAMPLRERASQGGRQLAKLSSRVAERLPAAMQPAVKARLAQLKVAKRYLSAVREEMRFDKDVLVVGTGQPIELFFTNHDGMPHNLVITAIGAMEEIGSAADRMATSADTLAQEYVPKSDKVLLNSRMLGTGKMQKLVFTAPETPGVYPLICSFPGHWLKMYAALVVSEDVAGFLAANPELSKDKLLGIVTYDHDFDALASQLADRQEPPSFERGQRAFASRSCVSCHSVRGQGGRVGPELTELSKENKPHEILRSLLFPSEKIDPNFAKVELEELQTGRIHTGVLIPQEDTEIVYLVDDPLLANCEPKIFRREEVAMVPLKVSPMPTELLQRSSPQEVLDLVAYLVAGGDPQHAVYRNAAAER
jgi:putative heme-binding domain-containing protein